MAKIKYKFNKDKLWFTADTHFHHEKIINYCNRPFANVNEMNTSLIENWNSCVGIDDDIIIGGDFIHTGNLELIRSTLDLLNGNKWLVMGNHCYQNKFERETIRIMFNHQIHDAMDFKVEDDEMEDGFTKFHVNHFPCEYWTRGAIHLHGHVHSGPKTTSTEKLKPTPMRYDIGVDNNDYKPISYNDVITKLTKLTLGYI